MPSETYWKEYRKQSHLCARGPRLWVYWCSQSLTDRQDLSGKEDQFTFINCQPSFECSTSTAIRILFLSHSRWEKEQHCSVFNIINISTVQVEGLAFWTRVQPDVRSAIRHVNRIKSPVWDAHTSSPYRKRTIISHSKICAYLLFFVSVISKP